jgi:peroxiredoxin
LAEYQERLEAFASLEADVVGVSVDDGVRSERIRRQLGLRFPLLCDPSRTVTRAWGLHDARDHRDVALPATLVVERDATLGLVSVEGTRERLRPQDVLAFLREGRPGLPDARALSAGLRLWLRAIGNVARHGWKTARSAPPDDG